MLFPAPVSFKEALDSRRVKALLPTSASSAELAALAPEILERATFSARTESAAHLSTIEAVVRQILDPGYVYDPQTGEKRRANPGEHVDVSRARELLRESLAEIGYRPDQIGAAPGSLKDLGSFKRLNVIIDTNVKMARGYGQWKQGQTSATLDEWPAQELIRVESRAHPREDWRERWREAGGQTYPGMGFDGKEGRLIALKNSPVWANLSRFGLPYPPFDYMSGLGVRDVDRDEGEALGVLSRDTRLAPQDRGFAEDLEVASPFDPETQGELFDALARSMGPSVEIQGGVLRFRSVPGREGATGSARTLGLRDPREMWAAPRPGKETESAARDLMTQGSQVKTPAGAVRLTGDILDHWQGKPEADTMNRMGQVQEAIRALRGPDEVWRTPDGQMAYWKQFEGDRYMVVFVDPDTKAVRSYQRRPLSEIRELRRGTLVYEQEGA